MPSRQMSKYIFAKR